MTLFPVYTFQTDPKVTDADNNTVSKNSIGLAQSGNGVFRSAGNNIVDGNTTETSGTITTFGPM